MFSRWILFSHCVGKLCVKVNQGQAGVGAATWNAKLTRIVVEFRNVRHDKIF